MSFQNHVKLKQLVKCFKSKIITMKTHSIFTNFVSALGVKHTAKYSDNQFANMDFKSLFGLSQLLDAYGIPNAGWKVPVNGSLVKIKTPFIAQYENQFDIIESINDTNVQFISQGKQSSMPLKDYESKFTGVVLTAQPDSKSKEPDYIRHRILDFAAGMLNWIIIAAFVAIIAYLYITRVFYHNAAATVLIAVNLIGLAITAMLMLKSVNVHLKVADNVCGILQEGGCDKILALDASKFFGLFGWAEVGFGYFIVSTAALLLFPNYIHYLALANLCCLPFTFWSIWYQKFRAKHWCTLCVITQTLLWSQFVCYLCGGFERDFNLCCWQPWILVACYVFTVLILNKTAQLLNGN